MAQRILRGAPATLAYEHLDADGAAVDAAGTMTVGVTAADGTVVLAAGTTTVHGVTGAYSVALTGAETAQLGVLTATWSDSAAAAAAAARTSSHEVVGGFMFSIAQVREFEPGLEDAADFPAGVIVDRRLEVEDEAEWICDIAFVPRYRRLTLDGGGDKSIVAGVRAIRRVRSVRTYSSAGSSSYTAMSAGQLAGLVVTVDGLIRRTDGGLFEVGHGNIVIEVEHGLDEPPGDLRVAALVRMADRLQRPDSGIPTRARSYSAMDGFSYDLTIPDEFTTGIPAVDAVYTRHSRRQRGDGSQAPASRPMNFDPQYNSLYRGGIQ